MELHDKEDLKDIMPPSTSKYSDDLLTQLPPIDQWHVASEVPYVISVPHINSLNQSVDIKVKHCRRCKAQPDFEHRTAIALPSYHKYDKHSLFCAACVKSGSQKYKMYMFTLGGMVEYWNYMNGDI